MIKNDRQYRLTKAQVRQFADAIDGLKTASIPPDTDPQLIDLQRRAMESQLEEMAADIKEYEALRNGQITQFEAESLADLPSLLVKARIARGITQKELAERLKLKEQQIQRWEANDYHGASLGALKSVSEALSVVLRQQLLVPDKELTPKRFLSCLKKAGIPSEFVINRIAPARTASLFRDESAGVKEIVTTASAVAKVYGLDVPLLLSLQPCRVDLSRIAATRFKIPARANRAVVDAYTIYAHYLSALLVDCVSSEASTSLPKDPTEFHRAVSALGQPITFERVIRFLWSCGTIVLPLRVAGGFHGAVWKIRGRFVIVLKQSTNLESLWIYDSLHETGHVENGDVTEDIALIEEKEIEPVSNTKEEEDANEWAEDALFGGRSEEIEEACTRACNGRLQDLKNVLPTVAKRFNVHVGALANHMAYRLGQQGENWWGAAKNLQLESRCPFATARDVLLENVDLLRLGAFDRALVERAFAED